MEGLHYFTSFFVLDPTLPCIITINQFMLWWYERLYHSLQHNNNVIKYKGAHFIFQRW